QQNPGTLLATGAQLEHHLFHNCLRWTTRSALESQVRRLELLDEALEGFWRKSADLFCKFASLEGGGTGCFCCVRGAETVLDCLVKSDHVARDPSATTEELQAAILRVIHVLKTPERLSALATAHCAHQFPGRRGA